MSKSRPLVVVGILGTRLDAGKAEGRWNQWRPSVALCRHEDLLIRRFELLHQPSDRALAEIIAADIQSVSPETEVRLHTLEFRDPWDFEIVFADLHELTRRLTFRTDEEDYLIHITTGSHVQQICLFLLTESRHFPGRLLQTSPPGHNKATAGTYKVIDLDLSKYDKLAGRFAQEQREDVSFLKSGIETKNRAFNGLIELIERVAIGGTAPLLITGPTGAGKSQLATRMYELKRRREQVRGEFVQVNCATLRGDQAMSALFGHAKGAFTGASAARAGLLKAADGGVLFLDEIGELGLDEQAMLLRAIEEKRFLPVGSDREVGSEFQLLAGTNRDLPELVRDGCFREDLLARINLWTFRLPALAERREDIAPNLDFELERHAAQTGRKIAFNKEAREAFLKFAESSEATWSANFRDLNAAIVRMATLCRSGRINADEVEAEIQRLKACWKGPREADNPRTILSSVLSADAISKIDLFDQIQLAAIVSICRSCKSLSDAGRKLFAVSRNAKSKSNDADRLRKYLARFELAWEDL